MRRLPNPLRNCANRRKLFLAVYAGTTFSRLNLRAAGNQIARSHHARGLSAPGATQGRALPPLGWRPTITVLFEYEAVPFRDSRVPR